MERIPPSAPLDLRDDIAVAAMNGLLFRDEFYRDERGHEILAKRAYQIADAMLAERAK